MLFPTHIVGGGVNVQQGPQYDVAPEGRFLINTELDAAAAPITLIQHWSPDQKKSRRARRNQRVRSGQNGLPYNVIRYTVGR